jgi:hypothetical protein
MSDKLEELRARMRAVWNRIDGVQEDTRDRKVIHFATREPLAIENDGEGKEGGDAPSADVNPFAVQMFRELLAQAEAGNVVSASIVYQTNVGSPCAGVCLNANETAPPDQAQALMHLGTLPILEDMLKQIAEGLYLDEDMDE